VYAHKEVVRISVKMCRKHKHFLNTYTRNRAEKNTTKEYINHPLHTNNCAHTHTAAAQRIKENGAGIEVSLWERSECGARYG